MNRRKFRKQSLLPPLSILFGLTLWEILVRVSNYPAFILPAPSRIFMRFVTANQSGLLLYHTGVTFVEVLSGMLIGAVFALLLGYLLAHSKVAEKVLFPYLVASQAIPTAAIAPLLIIWFGAGYFPKILICSLTVFFPLLINVLVGYQSIERNLSDLMTSMNASRWDRLRYLEIPGTMPVVLGGLKISATLSVIGAVVGELTGSNAGLGYLINVARGQYDTAMVFVAVITLMCMAVFLYSVVGFAEKRVLKWKKVTHGIS